MAVAFYMMMVKAVDGISEQKRPFSSHGRFFEICPTDLEWGVSKAKNVKGKNK